MEGEWCLLSDGGPGRCSCVAEGSRRIVPRLMNRKNAGANTPSLNEEEAPDQRAKDIASAVVPLRERGASLREIAAQLSTQEIPTPRGGAWSADAVRRVLLRLDRV